MSFAPECRAVLSALADLDPFKEWRVFSARVVRTLKADTNLLIEGLSQWYTALSVALDELVAK
jgi:hypothetical protein